MTVTGKSRLYWLMLALAGISFESIALYYQHALGEMPCVLCIQVRLWVAALIVLSLGMLYFSRFRIARTLGHLLGLLIGAGLLERSYRLLGTERGFLFGDCGFELGLPAWFTPDQWLPYVFQVETTCGYTPELLFSITMAEALLVLSAVFVLVCVVVLAFSAWRWRSEQVH